MTIPVMMLPVSSPISLELVNLVKSESVVPDEHQSKAGTHGLLLSSKWLEHNFSAR